MKNKLRVVGIMSGTSMDAVDFVLCEVSKKPLKIKYISMASVQFAEELRNKIVQAASDKMNVSELAQLHHELGKFFAVQLSKVVKLKKWKVDLIGLHGQTVFHSGGKATLQIGEPSYLKEYLSKPVVSDFRVADIAAGGQGAPLATKFHQLVFANDKNGVVAVNNLGGISNVSYFDGKKIFAFDTGPANMLIDLWLQKYADSKIKFDKNGEIAASGIYSQELVSKWLMHPFFAKKPAKSCGREEFGEVFLDKIKGDLDKLSFNDQIATLTELTAQSIAKSYREFFKKMPKKVFVCGGGAKNAYLINRIRYHLPEVSVHSTRENGWDTQAIEGGAFALLAALRVWNMIGNISATTGAKKSVVLGKIC